MQFTVNSALWRQVFAVPAEITDRHIRMCSGVALKCLLLLLRDPDVFGDPKAIADRLGQPVSEISDALSYWLETGVLSSSGPRWTGHSFTASPSCFGTAGGGSGSRPAAFRRLRPACCPASFSA